MNMALKKICALKQVKLTLFISMVLATFTYAEDDVAVKKATKEEFWGTLYKNGGKTFFCSKDFERKTMVLTEFRIYSERWIRAHLDCGTPRNCRKHNKRYRQILTDWHNTVPVTLSWVQKNKGIKYEEVGADVATERCGEKRALLLMEPPDRLKGDIARALLHIESRYQLPRVGRLSELKKWHLLDPPDEVEKLRNIEIKKIIGFENEYITNPAKANALEYEVEG